MVFIKNKKANETITEQVIFIVLNLMIFAALLFFVYRTSSSEAGIEENYAKKIGLAIDSLKPGTEMNISISEIYNFLEKNKIDDQPILLDYPNNLLTVKISSKTGYTFHYFSELKEGSVTIDKTNKLLIIKT